MLKHPCSETLLLPDLLEQHYEPENPFHNATHAADVAQALHCLLSNLRSVDSFEPKELLASILAALAHDVNHPGVNQNFLIKTASHLMKINGVSLGKLCHTSIHTLPVKILYQSAPLKSASEPIRRYQILTFLHYSFYHLLRHTS